jgi:hypothetical protein
MSNRAQMREVFINTLVNTGKSQITRSEIKEVCAKLGLSGVPWFTKDESNRVGRGLYRVPNHNVATIDMQAQVIPMTKQTEQTEQSSNKIKNIVTDLAETNLVPTVYKNYVPFGNFEDILAIVKSMRFFPVFVTGHSGNGKTMSVEQACAKAKRKFICVSMTPETDESDLLGNYVLIDGNMEWRDGPVTTAARQGAVLCIDEIDYGAQNLSSLQRVLEGKPFMLKKKGELITPTPGFTVFATANTKGKGSDDGRYMFTNVLNEAFLERFRNTMEQEWPSTKIERKIIEKELVSANCEDDAFAEKLVIWADVIRKTFADGGCDEVISTRRLVHIVETFGIFGDKMKSIGMCLNRFDDDTKASFLDLYTKVDAGNSADQILASEVAVETKPSDEEIPF